MRVATRFAPSPTGALHIGGARSALFNYHFAKKNKGLFLLRIEDTDKERNTQAALQSILNGLDWLGIKSDKPPVFQSENAPRHTQAAQQLLNDGLAYLSYEKKVVVEGKTEVIKTDSPSVNLKIPTGKTLIHDTVHGDIEFDNQDIGEIVLLRSNLSPTYMLSVVVDDIDMQITHVVRGDDHLSNTPKQMLIYQALKQKVPSFTHMPLIHGMDGKKLSKRHNAVSVEEYKNMGYLPEAMCNYLMLLGWNPKSEKEIFSSEELTEHFKLEDINKSAARFDIERLNYINLQHIHNMPDEQLLERIKERIQSIVTQAKQSQSSQGNLNATLTPTERERILQSLPECRKQNNLNEIAKLAYLFLPNAIITPEEEAAKLINNNKPMVAQLVALLANLNAQTEDRRENFDTYFKEFLSSNGYKFGSVGPILRSLLIGKTSSVNIGTIIQILGTEEAEQRARTQAGE